MRIRDRLRIEVAVQRHDFWLDFRGVSRSRRRELRRELRANLADATAAEGAGSALRGIGSPRTLAYEIAETSPARARWAVGAHCALGLFVVLATAWLFSVIGFVDGVVASGVTDREVSGPVFPWGGEVVAEVGADGAGLSVAGTVPVFIWASSLATFLIAAQPWRPLLHRRRSRSVAPAH